MWDTFEYIRFQEGEAQREQRQTKEKCQHKQPLGSIQVLFGLLHVAHIEKLFRQTRIDYARNARDGKAPAAKQREYIDVTYMIVCDVNVGLF